LKCFRHKKYVFDTNCVLKCLLPTVIRDSGRGIS